MKLKTAALWIGFMMALFMLVMVCTFALGEKSSNMGVLKCIQVLQTMAFALPTFFCLWIYRKKPVQWLRMDKKLNWKQAVLAVVFMLVAVPCINLLLWLNEKIPMPDLLTQFSSVAEELTKKLIVAENAEQMVVNLFVIALMPALCEEICFRGTIQQYIKSNPHVAIWVAAIIFSAIHMQFEGFIPRMLMGAAFGYMFYWSGNLWMPVLAHFTNNAFSVIMYNVLYQTQKSVDEIDTLGTGETIWLGILSCVLVAALFVLIRRCTRSSLNDDK